MFYSWQILAKGGPLQVIWLAAHTDPRKLERQKVVAASIPASIDSILRPQDPAGRLAQAVGRGFAADQAAATALKHSKPVAGARDGIEAAPLALRLSGQLLLGVVRVYNKKASLLEGDLEDTLERLQHEVGAPALPPKPAPDIQTTQSKETEGSSKRRQGDGQTGPDGVHVCREGLDAASLEADGRTPEGGGKKDGRGQRAIKRHQVAEGDLQEWMAELAAAEEEEVFLRRGSGCFNSMGSQSQLPSYGSQWGHALAPHSSSQQPPLWAKKGGSKVISRTWSQQLSGSQEVKGREQGAEQQGTGSKAGVGLDLGDETFEDLGGIDYDLNDLDLSGHEALLLTQPSAAPSAQTNEKQRQQAVKAGAEMPDKQESLSLNKIRDQVAEEEYFTGEEEEQHEMSTEDGLGGPVEGRASGVLVATPQQPAAQESTPSNAIFGRHHPLPLTHIQSSQGSLGSEIGTEAAHTRAYAAGGGHPCIHLPYSRQGIQDSLALSSEDAGCRSHSMTLGTGSAQEDSQAECVLGAMDSSGQETFPGAKHTEAPAEARKGRFGSVKCLLPLFTRSQSTDQQQQKTHLPPPELCPHTRLGMKRVKPDHTAAGVGGWKVEPSGKVVNSIELPASYIKQLLQDTKPLKNHARKQQCSNPYTALLRAQAQSDLPYWPSNTSTPPLLTIPPARYPAPYQLESPTLAKPLKPAIPLEVTAVPELAFILHESGLCSPSHLLPELRWLYYDALGWGVQPQHQRQDQPPGCAGRSKGVQAAAGREKLGQKKGSQEEQRQQGKRALEEQEQQGEQGAEQEADLWFDAQEDGQPLNERELDKDQGLHGGGTAQHGQKVGRAQGEELQLIHDEEERDEEQDSEEDDIEEQGERDRWLGRMRESLGKGKGFVLEGFTARTHRLLLRLRLLLLGKEEQGILGSPIKKRRTLQQHKGGGQEDRQDEVSLARDLLAEQLAEAARGNFTVKGGRVAKAGRGNKAAGAAAPSNRMCAVRTFHDLLVLQTGGYVRIQQRNSFEDMCVKQGPKLAAYAALPCVQPEAA